MFHRAKIERTTFLLHFLNYKITQFQNYKINLDLKNKSKFLPEIGNQIFQKKMANRDFLKI